MSEVDIIPFSTNGELTEALGGLDTAIRAAALANVPTEGYTTLEKRAMLVTEELRQINGVDLYAVLARGKRLRQIREEQLELYHPGYQGRSYEQLAKDNGVSPSELSNIEDLYNIIFPYLVNVMGMNLPELWEQVGKSNFREIIPVLKAMITGEAGTASVQATIDNLLEEMMTIMTEAGQETEDTEEVVQLTIENLIQDAALLTNRRLRERLRPVRMDVLNAAVLQRNDQHLVMLELDDRQLEYLRRKLNDSWDAQTVDIDPENPETMVRANSLPEISALRRLLGG